MTNVAIPPIIKSLCYFTILISTINCSLLQGPNICKQNETYSDKKKISVMEPYIVEEYVWCFQIPPRCPKLITVYKNSITFENVVKSRVISKCCPNYVESSDGKKCVPVCPDGCFNGSCVAPNICKCEPNYEGVRCDILRRRWLGIIPSYLDIKLNITACSPGFHGMNCSTICSPYKYGHNCALDCACQNSEGCDHITGKCQCLPGWIDHQCTTSCPVGKYGLDCLQDCQCNNGSICRNADGSCECKTGCIGNYCEICLETCSLYMVPVLVLCILTLVMVIIFRLRKKRGAICRFKRNSEITGISQEHRLDGEERYSTGISHVDVNNKLFYKAIETQSIHIYEDIKQPKLNIYHQLIHW